VKIAVVLGLLGTLCIAAAPLGTATELKGLRSLAASQGEHLWPGFGTAPFGFLILEKDREVLICRPSAPPAFKADGVDPATGCPRFIGPRGKLPEAMLAAMPLFGPPSTIVMGPSPTDEERLPRWRSTVLHEHMHQWQSELPGYYDRTKALDLADGDESGMWMLEFPFPYADPAVAASYSHAAAKLVAAVEARGTPAFNGRLAEYLSARGKFATAAGDGTGATSISSSGRKVSRGGRKSRFPAVPPIRRWPQMPIGTSRRCWTCCAHRICRSTSGSLSMLMAWPKRCCSTPVAHSGAQPIPPSSA
jgi:hypothetical protein